MKMEHFQFYNKNSMLHGDMSCRVKGNPLVFPMPMDFGGHLGKHFIERRTSRHPLPKLGIILETSLSRFQGVEVTLHGTYKRTKFLNERDQFFLSTLCSFTSIFHTHVPFMPDADFIGDFMSVTSIVNDIYASLVGNKGLLQ